MKKINLPDSPGVYIFKNKKGEILYIGKATSLRDRVRSYFSSDLIATRGRLLVDMVGLADRVDHIATDSVLEALLLEANLIKKHQPKYNTKEKDDRSHNFVVITDEDFPRIQIVRERNLEALGRKNSSLEPYLSEQTGTHETKNFSSFRASFGPFPNGSQLKEAMKIIRKIFPFRDKCEPPPAGGSGKPCFNRQLRLCPGVCTGEISEKEYAKRIKNIKLFFEGKKKEIIKNLEREMKIHVKRQEFEKASGVKRTIFALGHIQDIALLKHKIDHPVSQSRATPPFQGGENPLRIEAYDVAHSSGKKVVGVMVVVENGEPEKSQYRKFNIRINPGVDDTAALREILGRRFAHPEWPKPSLIVVDGSTAQINSANTVFVRLNLDIPIIAVVKDERHKPKGLMGDEAIIGKHSKAILLANSEAHRFALSYHRAKRDQISPRR